MWQYFLDALNSRSHLLIGPLCGLSEEKGAMAMNQQPNQDPILKDLIASAKRTQVTRRGLLAGGGAISIAAFLAACAPGKKTLSPAKDISATDKQVIWDNWPYYMDGEDGSFPTLKAFEKQSGITVHYNINVDDNNTYFARVKNQLAAGTDTGADTMCLTDWMIARLINSGYVQELDYAAMPNVSANLLPSFKDTFGSFDPGRKYSLPWKGIVAAIGYHKANYKKLTGKDAPATLEDLWDPALKGKVEVLSEMRDTLGVMMMGDGIDITSFTSDDFHNTLDKFTSLVSSGQIRGIKGNSYIEDYKNGDAVAGIVWAGDLIGANIELGSDVLGVVLLDSGSTFACDNFVIPMGAPHKANAEAVIDYYFQPEIAAKLALAGVNYVTPVAGAKELVIAENPELGNNPLMFPSDEIYATKLKQFRALTPKEDNEFSKAWSDAANGVV
jgi:spermidine/putrescine transport system substrate-binding protein